MYSAMASDKLSTLVDQEDISDNSVGDGNNKDENFVPSNAPTRIDEIEDEKMHEMTASYSEISMDSQASPQEDWLSGDGADGDGLQRPSHLNLHDPDINYLDDLEGTVTRDGDMVLFVAEDLETKIKLSSPVSKLNDGASFSGSRSSTPCLYRQALAPQLPLIDPNILNDLEAEARRVATSVDALTESLANVLHGISALTVDCLETYRDAVCKTCDAVDSNIKAMYQLMAKCEELSKTMEPIYKLADSVKEIKRLLEMLENTVHG